MKVTNNYTITCSRLAEWAMTAEMTRIRGISHNIIWHPLKMQRLTLGLEVHSIKTSPYIQNAIKVWYMSEMSLLESK